MTDCTACCTADVDNRKNVLQVEKYDINIMDDAVESFLKSMENIKASYIIIYYQNHCKIAIPSFNFSKEVDHYDIINIKQGPSCFLSPTGWI